VKRPDCFVGVISLTLGVSLAHGQAPVTPDPPAAPPPAAASEVALPAATEVTIQGKRTVAPGVSSFSREEIRQLPGAFGDPFRAIEALPGVTPLASGVPYFYIRGAPPGNVGYYVDGVRVPYLYHVALGPSVVHPALIERADLYPGGYPAQFGRFTGGIVAGETAPPRTDFHGEANVRLLDAGALVEAPFANGKGSALVGGRYSYTAAIVSLLAPDVSLAYRDYQARLSYDLSPRDRVTLFTFGTYDLVAEKQKYDLGGGEIVEGKNILFGAEFYRLDARYDHSFADRSTLRLALTGGFDQTRVADNRTAQDRMLGARAELTYPLGNHARLRAGIDIVADWYAMDFVGYADQNNEENRALVTLFPTRQDVALGARLDVVWQATPSIEVTPGLRIDKFFSGGTSAVGIDPRVAARVGLTPHVRFLHTFGVAHQPPSFVLPVPGLQVGNLQGGLQKSMQASSGIEVDLPAQTTLTTNVFKNTFFRMNDALGLSTRANDANPLEVLNQRSLGASTGFEVFLRRRLTSKVGGFLSYTLSRATRSLDRASFLSSFDRTHVLNAALAYNLGRSWRAGTRVVFYTGIPKQVGESNDDVAARLSSQSQRTSDRDPAFFRVDLRLEKRWPLANVGWISLIAEMLNATLSKEVVGSESIGPVSIPSVGVEATF